MILPTGIVPAGIVPVNINKLHTEWARLLAKVKTIEDFQQLSEDEQRLFRDCNILLAPSFAFPPSQKKNSSQKCNE